ncbi:hypothetical protein F8O07_09875 [Pseudoclavibacter sp. CFCC 13796]|nr:hypothetical protein F8O07_09875 [Pseudoclavibacter sp. CFCC 13796]
MTMNRMTRTALGICLVASASTLALTGCSSSDNGSTQSSTATSSDSSAEDARLAPSVCGTPEDDGQNHEIPVGDADEGPFHMEANYFQPGDMAFDGGMMPAYADSIAHIELDVKVNEEGTKYGWSVDETPADLNIDYTVTDKSGKEIVKGMFMEMNAADGSHYGTNIPKSAEAAGLVGSLENPGEYTVTFHIAPPKNYGLHQDKRTGVEATEWFAPFDVSMDWLYTAEQKKCIVDDPRA